MQGIGPQQPVDMSNIHGASKEIQKPSMMVCKEMCLFAMKETQHCRSRSH